VLLVRALFRHQYAAEILIHDSLQDRHEVGANDLIVSM
jgi:hypothetical protein